MFNRFNFDIAGLLPSDPTDLPLDVSGIMIEPKRTIVTDGHLLAIVTTPESQPRLFDNPDGMEEAEHFTPFQMDRESALRVAKVLPKRGNDCPEKSMCMFDVHTEAEPDSVLIASEDVRRAILKSVKRPVWKAHAKIDSFVPGKDAARLTVTLSTDLLTPLLRIMNKFSRSITMRVYGPASGVRIDAEGDDGQLMTAIVMPMRTDEQAEHSQAVAQREAEVSGGAE